MNMFKSNGGFTLVELIVVIAILAILAGIAVPAYSGYIKKAEQAADIQALAPVNTAAQGLAAAKGGSVTEIKVEKGTSGFTIKVTCSADAAGNAVTVSEADITALTGELKFGDNFYGATWVKEANATAKLDEGWNLTAKPADKE